MKNFFIFYILSFVLAAVAHAVPAGVTFQGRLVKNSTPVENAVTLTVKVTSPAPDECLLYEETHNLNLVNSDGLFSIKIGGGSRTGSDRGLSLTQVFSNTGTIINTLTCTGAPTTYTSAATDSRNIYISFVDGVDTVVFSSPYTVQAVPYALEAERLAGKSVTDFLQTTTDVTQAKMNSIMNTTNYPELTALLGGSSAKYMTSSATEGTLLPVLSAQPTLAAGKIWYEAGNIKYYDASSSTVKTLGTSTGSFQNGGNSFGADSSIGNTDAYALKFKTSNSDRMTILSGGNVGIGTTTPGAFLHVNTATTTTVGAIVKTTDDNTTKNLQEWQSSAGTAVASVSAGGALTGRSLSLNSGNGGTGNIFNMKGNATFDSGAIGQIPVNIYGRAGQTADLFRIGAATTAGDIMVVSAAGKVGIGAPSPQTNLEISGTAPALRVSSVKNGTWTAGEVVSGLEFYSADTSSVGAGVKGAVRLLSQDTTGARTDLVLSASSNATNDIEILRAVGDTARVGIGTAAPSEKLEVAGNIKAYNVFAGTLQAYSSTGAAYMTAKGSALDPHNYSIQLLENTANNHYWGWQYRNGTTTAADAEKFILQHYNGSSYLDHLTVTPAGNMGIGTTSPTSKLMLSETVSGVANSLVLENLSNFTDRGSSIVFKNGLNTLATIQATRSATTPGKLQFMTGNGTQTERMRIDETGNVGIGTTGPTQKLEVNGSILATSFLYSSDRRLKKDITPLDDELSKLLSLQPVRYHWISPMNPDMEREQLGLIAQEVRKVYPEAVHEDKKGWLRLDYPALIAPLIKAVQQLFEGQNQLARENYDLRMKHAELEKRLALENQELKTENAELEKRLQLIERHLSSEKKLGVEK